MLKYVDSRVVFQEIPDEITLAINISNCPCHCKGCHSQYLAEDIGKPLIEYPQGFSDDYIIHLDELITDGISCIAFMGGDSDPHLVNVLASFVKDYYPNLKVAWYSGRQELSEHVNMKHFDYIKLGPYIEENGPLNSKTTNQVMLHIDNSCGKPIVKDITSRFWK